MSRLALVIALALPLAGCNKDASPGGEDASARDATLIADAPAVQGDGPRADAPPVKIDAPRAWKDAVPADAPPVKVDAPPPDAPPVKADAPPPAKDAGRAPDLGPGGCASNKDCAARSYCKFASGCTPPGSCAIRPAICPSIYDPVCGCDGKTYGNACNAAAAGQSVRSKGACP